jgi:hypothetical protein
VKPWTMVDFKSTQVYNPSPSRRGLFSWQIGVRFAGGRRGGYWSNGHWFGPAAAGIGNGGWRQLLLELPEHRERAGVLPRLCFQLLLLIANAKGREMRPFFLAYLLYWVRVPVAGAGIGPARHVRIKLLLDLPSCLYVALCARQSCLHSRPLLP